MEPGQGSGKICESQGVKSAVLRDWSVVANVFYTLQIHGLLFFILLNTWGRGGSGLCYSSPGLPA